MTYDQAAAEKKDSGLSGTSSIHDATAAATSGTITIAATCDEQPVQWLELFVNVEGVNGEEVSAMRTCH